MLKTYQYSWKVWEVLNDENLTLYLNIKVYGLTHVASKKVSSTLTVTLSSCVLLELTNMNTVWLS